MRRRLNSRAFDPFDEWLESQGLYRKQVARDGSCLFRAVAEQVFMTQTKHVSVRTICLEYMMLHKEDFQPFLEEPVDHHVYKLQDSREWGGHTEILAMSRCFKVDFLIYQEIGRPPYRATENGYIQVLMLSYTHGNHYDIIYKKDDAVTRGYCQSLVYDLLYSRVFQLKDVRLAVDTMLHDKEYASLRRDSTNSTEMKEIGALVEKVLGTSISRDNSQDDADKNTSIEEKSLEDIHPDDVRGLLGHGIPPFPYKVAKSLDPDIYRNIEFDAWNTVRREARYGPIDINGFQAGVKVFIKLDLLPNRKEVENMRNHIVRQGNADNHDSKPGDERQDVFHGHIQEMTENKGPVDVFIEEIGARMKVPYESLEKVPPSPPRSPWHQQGRGPPVGGGGSVGGGVVVSSVPSYKKLTGYYQKAPLPPEPEYSSGRSKKKGKQMRENQANNCGGYWSRSSGSPTTSTTLHSNSPRARTPQSHHHNHHNSYASKGYPPRGHNNNNNNNGYSHSPAREPFPYCPTIPPPPHLSDGVYGVGPREVTLEELHQVMSAGGQQEVRVTGHGLEVISGDKEVPHCDTGIEENPSQFDDTSTPKTECRVNGSGMFGMGEESHQVTAAGEGDNNHHHHSPVTITDNNGLLVEPLSQSPALTTPNGEMVAAAPMYHTNQTITYISPPPLPAPQLGCPPPPSHITGPMYTVTVPPPYPSPGLVQVLNPVPTGEGNSTPSEFSSPPSTITTTTITTSVTAANTTTASTTITALLPHNTTESWDLISQGIPVDTEAMKMNQGMSPYMVYHVPMMYGGYGNYGYNQQWGYPIPVMPTPTVEDTKSSPVPGNEGYPQMIAVSGWNPGYTGEMMPNPQPMPSPVPQPPPPGPPHQAYPPLLRESTPLGFPPPHYHPGDGRDLGRERPFYPRGRGRGSGPHNFGHHRGSHHHNNSFQGGGFGGPGGRGGLGPQQRPLPPRFQRGGGGGPAGRGGGGPRYHHHNGPHHYPPHHNPPHHNYPNTPPHHHHRNSTHQYEGQPLMHMGSRKSSSDSLASQVASGGSVGSGGLASPPLMTYMEPERAPPQHPAMLPLTPHPDTSTMTQPDTMPIHTPSGYYPAPPGYVVTGPWMWKMV